MPDAPDCTCYDLPAGSPHAPGCPSFPAGCVTIERSVTCGVDDVQAAIDGLGDYLRAAATPFLRQRYRVYHDATLVDETPKDLGTTLSLRAFCVLHPTLGKQWVPDTKGKL